jgi:zinc and cadmium transporter
MTLCWILIATLAGGALSVAAAGLLSASVFRRWAPKMIGFAVGVMLSVTFLDLIPESASKLTLHEVGITILIGLFIFFALEKFALWRHDHSDSMVGAGAATVLLILVGDGIHNSVDGVLLAATFLEDTAIGWNTAAAIVAHEIPQEMGDFIILLSCGLSFRKALLLNILSSLGSVVGGLVGYFFFSGAELVTSYVLALAAASFLYIAAADLVPLLQKERKPVDFALQFSMLGCGVALIMLVLHSPV